MTQKKQKKKVTGKNKFLRLDEENLVFVKAESELQNRSENNYINNLITQERIKKNGGNRK